MILVLAFLIFWALFLLGLFIFDFLPEYGRKKDIERKNEEVKQAVERHKQERDNVLKTIGNTQEYQDFLKVVVRNFDKEVINKHSKSFRIVITTHCANLVGENDVHLEKYDFTEKGFELKSERDFGEKLEKDLKQRYPDYSYKHNRFKSALPNEHDVWKFVVYISTPNTITETSKPLKQI